MDSFDKIDFSALEKYGLSDKEKRLVRARSKLSYEDIQASVNNFCEDCRNPKTVATMKSPLGVFLNSCFKNEIWRKPANQQYESIEEYEKRIIEKRKASQEEKEKRLKNTAEAKNWYNELSEQIQSIITVQARRAGTPITLMTLFFYNAFILDKESFKTSLTTLLGEIDFTKDIKEAFRRR